MTDAQIEAIARAMCEKLGENPDFRGFSQFGGAPFHPNWWRYSTRVAQELHNRGKEARAVREAVAMREAITEVLGDMEGNG